VQNPNANDLSFYALVHHVLESSREYDESAERRTGRRRTFSCLQWLAPYRDGKLPGTEDFSRVQCVDLSSSGFSFLGEESADFEYVVVALGNPPTLFLSAEVVRRSIVPYEGQNRLRIGCRFVARLTESDYQPRLTGVPQPSRLTPAL
jgi:hypothetical protein